MKGVPIRQAAQRLRKHPASLRRWIAQGCPVIRLGSVGRTHGAIVDLDAVQRWRVRHLSHALIDRQDEELLAMMATAFWDTLKRDEVHRRVDVTEQQAASVLVLAYDRVWKNLTGRSSDELTLETMPPEMKRLCAIALCSSDTEHHPIRR